MKRMRRRILMGLLLGLWAPSGWAQESTGGSSPSGTTGSGSSSGSSPASGTGGGAGGFNLFAPSAATAESPFSSGNSTAVPPAPPSPGSNSASPSFRTGAASTLPEITPGTPPPEGAASAFDANTAAADAARNRTPPTTFSLPGFYGRGPQEYTVGQGRLARPRFRVTAGTSVGYDDNVFQTPTNARGVPDQTVQVLDRAATPATTREETVDDGDPRTQDPTRTVVVPGQEARFRTVRIPGIRAPERLGSFISRTEAGFDMQLSTRRSLFTFDLQGSAGYYWNRPGKKTEYTGSLGMIYLRKLTSRAQFTLALNLSYQAQPDFSQINTPTSNSQGSYLTANLKADLSYRLTPRISSVTSMAYAAVHYLETDQEIGNYGETTFGTELRYLFSPRLTLLGELRYSSSMHPEDPARDTGTYFLLLGGELRLSRRFTATLRVGEALQTFEEEGERSVSPYVENTISYRLGRGTTLQWNTRYGYEESGSANSETVVARTGLNIAQIFTPRFQGSLGLNLLRNTTTNSFEQAAGDSSDPTRTETVETETVQDTIDATIGFQYVLSRHWSFNLSYSYTMVIGPVDTSDYYRQRIFLGAEYLF